MNESHLTVEQEVNMNLATLKCQYGVLQSILDKVTDDINNDEALKSPLSGGNCANWVLGHLANARNSGLALLGKKPLYAEDKFVRYGHGAKPLNGSGDETPFRELVEANARLHKEWMAGLDGLTGDDFAKKAPFSPFDNPDETIGSLLAEVVIHEGYHIGQIGLLRRFYGKSQAVG